MHTFIVCNGQPIEREIDTEIEMIKKQLIKIKELQYAFSMMHAPQPPRAPLEHTPNDATVTLMLVISEEIKHSRCSKEIKFKSFKDITDEVPITLALQDWERTFAKLHMKPSIPVVLDKILTGGNLWKWYNHNAGRSRKHSGT